MLTGYLKFGGALPILLLFAGSLVADPLDHWTRRSVNGTPFFRAVAYGNGRFVATGDHGEIFTSITGASWEPCSSPTTLPIWSITYGNGLFLMGEFFYGPSFPDQVDI